jgi:hypothetical protein
MFFVPVYIGLFIDNISKNKAFDMLFKNRYFKGFISFLIALNIMLLVLMCFKPADEMISFYKKVYNLSGYPKTELITIGSENPYFRGGKNLAITYYKKANLNFKQLQSDTLLSKNLIIDKNTQYLFAVKKFDVRSEFEMNGLHFCKVYQTYPQWVVNFNFNNWMARTKVWTIYEVKK